MTTPEPADAAGEAAATSAILILGTAEWNSPIATNQHYVTRELAQEHQTYFVESLGLRRVRLDGRDVSRMVGRVRRLVQGHISSAYRQVPARTKVISPVVVPVHRKPTGPLNRRLLERAVAEWRQMPRPRVLWTFTPVTYGLERYADFTVYHCVDILHAFPGIDAHAVNAGEARLARQAPLAIATSGTVARHLAAVGFPEIVTLPNVADVDIFSSFNKPAAQRRPAALFAGNLSPHKLDFPLLRRLAEVIAERGELLLAGPIAAGGGTFHDELAELQRLGAKYLGVLTIEQLAEVAGGCTVGLIPYALNDYTAGVSPLKCYEYLAAGLGVVSTSLPDVRRAAESTPFIYPADTRNDFVASVLTALAPGPQSEIDARTAYAQGFGWRSRGQVLRRIATSHRLASDALPGPGTSAGTTR